MSQSERAYQKFIQSRAECGALRTLESFTPVSPRLVDIDGQEYVNFSSNDYLGLSHHPALTKAAQDWAEQYGAGSTASRLVVGNFKPYEKVEEKLAALKGKEAALIMATGYQCNVSVLAALFDKSVLGTEPLVFADRLNHASMHAGCQMAGVKQIRYRHCDSDHLQSQLKKYETSNAPKFILTESVFSMDGTCAPMSEICTLAKAHNAFVICDDAHASGILGERGQGLANKANLIIGTFGKAFGSFGAYVACTKDMKEYLINKCGGVIYSTALPPSVWGSIDAAIDLVPAMDKERMHVKSLSDSLRQNLSNIGFSFGDSKTQIVPIIVGENEAALQLSSHLKEKGIWAQAIRPPTVPAKTARLRIAINAAHTDSDIEKLSSALQSFEHQKAA